jgi:hypothetical protein
MQQEKKEERRQTEETTKQYLKSIARRHQYKDDLERVLAQFIDIETGACLECGQIHGFTNIDEANRRERRTDNNSSSLEKLFWEAAV